MVVHTSERSVLCWTLKDMQNFCRRGEGKAFQGKQKKTMNERTSYVYKKDPVSSQYLVISTRACVGKRIVPRLSLLPFGFPYSNLLLLSAWQIELCVLFRNWWGSSQPILMLPYSAVSFCQLLNVVSSWFLPPISGARYVTHILFV